MAFNRIIHLAKTPVGGGGGDIVTGLVSYWPMNEGTGTGAPGTAFDTVSGHNGTIINNASLITGALQTFSGADSLQIADNAAFNFGTAMTAFIWVNAAPATSGMFSQFDYTLTDKAWFMAGQSVGSHNTLRVNVSDSASGGTEKDYEGSIVCLDNTWHSVAFRWGSGALSLFVDGVKETSINMLSNGTLSGNSINNSAAPIQIGSMITSGSPGNQLYGLYKKARLYNIAKTDADIMAMHLA